MVEATRQLRAAGSAPPVCIAIHAVFADAVNDELMLAGAQGIVTCDTIPHAPTRSALPSRSPTPSARGSRSRSVLLPVARHVVLLERTVRVFTDQ